MNRTNSNNSCEPLQYTINSDVYESGEVRQDLHQVSGDEDLLLIRWISQTRDDGMIESLKKLGWTPPIDQKVKCVFEIDCSARSTGHCALSNCPKFLKRH